MLTNLSPRCFSIFKRSIIQSVELPLSDILDSTLNADAFQEEKVNFGNTEANHRFGGQDAAKATEAMVARF